MFALHCHTLYSYMWLQQHRTMAKHWPTLTGQMKNVSMPNWCLHKRYPAVPVHNTKHTQHNIYHIKSHFHHFSLDVRWISINPLKHYFNWTNSYYHQSSGCSGCSGCSESNFAQWTAKWRDDEICGVVSDCQLNQKHSNALAYKCHCWSA